MVRKLLLLLGLVGAVVVIGAPGALGKGAFPKVDPAAGRLAARGDRDRRWQHLLRRLARRRRVYRGDLRTGAARCSSRAPRRAATGLEGTTTGGSSSRARAPARRSSTT